MRVHHLNCGTMRPFGGRLLDGEPGVLRTATLVCHVLLIEADDGLVLVDSGYGTADVADPAASLGRLLPRVTRPVLDVEETAARQIVRLGFAAEDVRHIVLTHLDPDHAGGLRDFPHATVHLYAEELAAATAPRTRAERVRYRTAQWAHGPNWRTYPATEGEDWYGFRAVRELAGVPGLALVPLAGHTRGHAGVAVRTGDRWLLHCGDAYYFRGQVHPTHPYCPPGVTLLERGVQTVPASRLSNVERLRELAREHVDEVEPFCAHDPVDLRRLS